MEQVRGGRIPETLTSKEVFGEVLREVIQLYPSLSYGLVVFSHASGWLPEGTLSNPVLCNSEINNDELKNDLKSIVIDNGSEMEFTDFASAIPDGMFDFIIFDACFMAGIEVAWELKDKTDYIIASSAEVVSPGLIPLWADGIRLLFQPQADLAGFLKMTETDYQKRSGDYRSLTLSVIKTNELDALAATLRKVDCEGEVLVKEVMGGSHAPVQSFNRGSDNLFFDFGDYFGRMVSDSAGLQDALDRCVVAKVATATFMPNYGGFDIISNSGLTTYIPQEQYPKLNEAYKQLKWYKDVLVKQ